MTARKPVVPAELTELVRQLNLLMKQPVTDQTTAARQAGRVAAWLDGLVLELELTEKYPRLGAADLAAYCVCITERIRQAQAGVPA